VAYVTPGGTVHVCTPGSSKVTVEVGGPVVAAGPATTGPVARPTDATATPSAPRMPTRDMRHSLVAVRCLVQESFKAATGVRVLTARRVERRGRLDAETRRTLDEVLRNALHLH
jgi:hypothetical protein